MTLSNRESLSRQKAWDLIPNTPENLNLQWKKGLTQRAKMDKNQSTDGSRKFVLLHSSTASKGVSANFFLHTTDPDTGRSMLFIICWETERQYMLVSISKHYMHSREILSSWHYHHKATETKASLVPRPSFIKVHIGSYRSFDFPGILKSIQP